MREVGTRADLPETLKWSKFSGAAWAGDGSGFYYCRYPKPVAGEIYQGANFNQRICFHLLNTPQEADRLVYERPDQPDWGFGAEVTDDGRFLLVYQTEGTDPRNRVFLQDLRSPDAGIVAFLDAFDADYQVVGNDGDVFYVRTDKDAPRRRLVAIDRRSPSPASWKQIVPQDPGQGVLSSVHMIGERLVAVWQIDAHDRIRIYRKDGTLEHEVALPGIGNATVSGRRRSDRCRCATGGSTCRRRSGSRTRGHGGRRRSPRPDTTTPPRSAGSKDRRTGSRDARTARCTSAA